MKFSYVAYNAASEVHRGKIEAGSLKEATKLLLSQGWYIRKITPVNRLALKLGSWQFGGVALMDKLLLIRHLGVMLKSGINLNEALQVVAEQTASKRFSKIINEVLRRLKTGQTLASSLAKFPRVFDPLFINIIKVGEESGSLEENLEHLGNELENRLELKRNIQAAAFYPAIVLGSTFGLGLILAYFVLPKIKRLFESLTIQLPWQTKILIWFAGVMDKHGLLIVGGIIAGVLFFKFLTTLKFFKPVWQSFLLKLPILGQIIINYNLVIFSRTLGILLRSGLTIDRALMIVGDTTSNVIYRKKIKGFLPEIQKGKRLADILAQTRQSKHRPLFPLLVIKMIDVGERSGRLDDSFNYLAEYFSKEVDHTSKNLTTILEPILLIGVGLIVGFIAISVIMPIYQITGSFSQ